MKTFIIAVSAAALIAAAPAAGAQNLSRQRHKATGKHAHLPSQGMQTRDARAAHPEAFGYASDRARAPDRETEASRQAGGGGGM